MKKRIILFIFLSAICPSTLFALNGVHVEAELSESSPYVRQKIIYSIRVVSSISLSKVTVSPPTAAGVVLEKADGPRNSYRTGTGGQRLVVNEYRYLITPLTPGYTELPPAHVKVTPRERRNGSGNYYNYNPWQRQNYPAYARENDSTVGEHELMSNSVVLTIRPPMSDESSWLPLYQAEIRGKLQGNTNQVSVGKPINLILTFRATGLGGDGLPGLAQFLQSPDVKLYSDRPITGQKLSRDGKTLYGQRKETITIIPQKSGNLELPEIRVPWWDLYNHRPTEVSWHPPVLTVVDSAQDTSLQSVGLDRQGSTGLSIFALFALGFLMFAVGWWIGAGRPELPLSIRADLSRVWVLTLTLFKRVLSSTRQLFEKRLPKTPYKRVYDSVRLHIRRNLPVISFSGRARRLIARITPRPIKTWHLIRRVGRETDPVRIAKLLQDYAKYALNMPANTPLHTIATEISERYPHLNSDVTKALFTNLDTAIYGDTQMDSKRWHKAFNWLFMRMIMGRRYKPHLIDVIGLPELNP